MGAYNCDSARNRKLTFEQIELLFQNTLNLKEISNKDKNLSIQYNLSEEKNLLKFKSKNSEEDILISKKYKNISGFKPLAREKYIFEKWVKLIYNFYKVEDFKNKRKQNIPIDEIFQNNLENAFQTKKKYFLKLVATGLPNNLRQFIWTTIIDKDEKDKSNISNNEKEKNHFQTLISLDTNKNDLEQIQKDINRTFLNEKDKTEKNLQTLKQLLIALNNLDEKIGYCQGINFIVGFILKVTNFDKIKAFHLSRLILGKIKGYFSKGFPLLKYNLKIFNEGFTTLLPKLYCHFKDNDIIDELWVGKWIQTLFTLNMPFQETCYIWDALLVYGMDFIIPISLSILYLTEKKLLKLNDSSDILSFLEETLNPINNSGYIKYKEDITLENYIIPITDIISCAKKIRNQLNLGGDGSEYNQRNLLDNRESFNNLKSSLNYETKMEKLKAQKKEENRESCKSNPSMASTNFDDLSSTNIKMLENSQVNKNGRRINKFFTVHHKINKDEKNITNNNIENNENVSNRSLSHNDNNKSITNNKRNIKSPIINYNKSNINYPFFENNSFVNSTKFNNKINASLFNDFPIRNQLYNNYNHNSNNDDRPMSANNKYNSNYYNDSLNSSNLNKERFNFNNLTYHGKNSYNSFNFNNMNQNYNNLNYLYKNNLDNNFFRIKNYDNNFINLINNNLNLLQNQNIFNSYINTSTNINDINNFDNNKFNKPKESFENKKKLFNNKNFNTNNEVDDNFFNGVNEFWEGEKNMNKIPKFKSEIPKFNSVKGVNGS